MSNDFLPFAIGGGANVESQADYAVDPLLGTGNVPGIAVSAFNNKAIRQSSVVVSQLAQLIANQTGTNVVDNGVTAQLLAQLSAAILPLPAIITTVTATGSGTYTLPVVFFTASANATVGATYTNNGATFTVRATISGATQLRVAGTAAPTTSGTLALATGSGDATIAFYAFRAAARLKVRCVAGGGGGAGSGTSAGGATSGGNGADTTFGTSLIDAGGGTGGTFNSTTTAAGGTAALGSGPIGFTIIGGAGSGWSQVPASGTQGVAGGSGGNSAFGGAGAGGAVGAAGRAGAANTGGGGGGGGTGAASSTISGNSGAGGGYVEGNIFTPLYSYAYSVGLGGTAGVAGTSGFNGSAGGTGLLIIEATF
jgi:hypothetical protein